MRNFLEIAVLMVITIFLIYVISKLNLIQRILESMMILNR